MLLKWHAKRPIVETHEASNPEGSVPSSFQTIEPEKLRKLTLLFQFLLPLVFVCMSTVNPYLPVALAAVGVPLSWQTVVAATWMLARLAGFVFLWKTTFWYGRFLTAIVAVGMAMTGCIVVFAVPTYFTYFRSSPADLSSTSSSQPAFSIIGLAIILGGLAVYGFGLATIGNSCFVYTIQKGSAHVSSTALFEFISSTGSIVGPVVGLGFFGLQQWEILGPEYAPPLTLGIVLVIIVTLTTAGFTVSLRSKPKPPKVVELNEPTVAVS